MFLDQFKDFLVLILIGASIVSMIAGEGMDANYFSYCYFELCFRSFQENRASNALKALKDMAAQRKLSAAVI